MRHDSLLRLSLWTTLYAALAVAVTFPLATHLSSALPHDLGDPLLSTSLLWWNAHVVPLTARWWNGLSFFPATGTVAFSDHRLGMSLIASPLQWLGCSPVTAYNVTLLATFPLCALAAHGLAFTLTRRHDAAALCGLAYGFNPYRIAHIEHLELLTAFAMPAALAALHMFARTRRVRWMLGFAAALIVQGLSSSYYLLFFTVFTALWALWFVRWRDWPFVLAIGGAWICCLAALAPIVVGYYRIHQHYGFARSTGEVLAFSGDVTSLVTASPLLSIWGWTARINGPERQLFPGFTIATLALAGAVAALRRSHAGQAHPARISIALATVAGVCAAAAISVPVIGPWRVALGPLTLSVGTAFKPFSLAIVALIGSIAALPRARAAYHGRSAFAFYLIATAALFTCSFGPKPAFLGTQILYEPPYAWLMRLPLFADAVRVPARFAMLAALALSVSGALAFSRLRADDRTRCFALVALMIGIVADGWMRDLALPEVPAMWPVPPIEQFATVLELPLAENFAEFVAMYRATRHGRPSVNGNSGYRPPHYIALELAIAEGDQTALDAITVSGPALVVVDKQADADGHLDAFVRTAPRVTAIGGDQRWTMFAVAPLAAGPVCGGSELAIAGASSENAKIDTGALTDRNPWTWWVSSRPQRVGDMLLLDLGRPARLCSVRMSLATSVHVFPRLLNVATSPDGTSWTTTFVGKTGGLAIRGAVAQPRDIWFEVPAASAAARFIRLRLDAAHDQVPWFIPDLAVIGTPLSDTSR